MSKKITKKEKPLLIIDNVLTDEEYGVLKKILEFHEQQKKNEEMARAALSVETMPYGAFVLAMGNLYQKIKQEDGDKNYFVKHSPVARMAFSLKNSNNWEKSDIHWVLDAVERLMSPCLDPEGDVTIFSKKEVEENKKILDLDTENCSHFWTRSALSSNTYNAWGVLGYSSYSLYYDGTYDANGVLPALWLRKDLGILSGDGSKNDPYELVGRRKEENG
jgi:hypothetical protein